MLKEREFRQLQKRLNGAERRLDREDSISRMSSFRTSREGKDSKGGHAEGGAGAAGKPGGVAATFPRFYSTRHNKLLPPKGAFFDVDPARLVQMFHTDVKLGLKKDDVAERQQMYGKNELPPAHQTPFIVLLWDQLKDFIILVLLAASIVSLAIQDWESAGVLMFVVLVNVAIGLIQEYRSANALKALNSFAIPQAQVIRDGEQTIEPASELVPGDIVILDEGANVPADVRCLEVSQLSTIEAILTGESLPILKSTGSIKPRGRRYLTVGDRVNMAFMSTLVSKGRAVCVVVNTGATTEVGRIYSALSTSASETVVTPLQRKLGTLGKWLVLVSVVACAAVIGIGLGRGYGTDIIQIGISLAVSVIPEGLVTVVTLTMAIGTQRMAKKKAIARNLPAVETLGSLTTICSDKTGVFESSGSSKSAVGSKADDSRFFPCIIVAVSCLGTLTEGKMKTERMWVASAGPQGKGQTLRFITASKVIPPAPKPAPNGVNGSSTVSPVPGDIEAPAVVAAAPPAPVHSGSGPAPGGSVSVLLNDSLTVRSVSELPVPLLWSGLNACLNNNAQVKVQDVVDGNGKIKQEEVLVGDATEVALLRATQQAYCDATYWTTTYGLKRVLEFAFDSDRKRMSVVLELPPDESGAGVFLGVARPADCTHLLLVKGAPEAVLNKSTSFLDSPAESASAAGEGSSSSSSLVPHRVSPLTSSVEDSIESEGSMMADRGMRVLATAFRFLTAAQVQGFKDDLAKAMAQSEAGVTAAAASGGASGALVSFSAEKDLSFIGLAGIMDPPRVEVADAIAMAHGAGIRVCMITGDHFNTGLAIAKQIGIFNEARGDRAMNGDALAVLSEEQLSQLNPFPVVFTRVSPDNKLKLVKSLQRRGEICAMTGDGQSQ
jgi:Ca2+-transporting ATPase